MPVDAIILAGGRGTRLASVVADVPKPLAEVAGRPFLDLLMDFLMSSGRVGRVVVSAGYKAELIQAWAAQAPWKKISVVVEQEPLGTGGGLLLALDHVASDTVLALNGDSLVRLDLAALLEAHRASGAAFTMAVTPVADVSGSGEVVLDGARVTAFREKGGDPHAGWINAGIYVMQKAAMAAFPRRAASLEYDLVPELLKAGVNAYRASGAFVDIGTPATYAAAGTVLGIKG